MMDAKSLPHHKERRILTVAEQHLRPLHPARRLVREREITISRSMSSSFIANSTACRHLAMMPFLVHTTANKESTNKLPVPWMPVSWNRSSSRPYISGTPNEPKKPNARLVPRS
jgi:hypothetical protein